jgi:O-antigen ligase
MKAREGGQVRNRVAAFVLFVAIAGAPLPFGSRDPVTVAAWCALLGLGLIFASPRYLRAGHLALLAGIAAIVAGYGFVLHEQLADRPWLASPNPVWAKTAELLRQPVSPSVSIVRGEPFYALGAPLAAVLALILGLVVGSSRDLARRAVWMLAWSGVAYAVYGFFVLVFDPGHILWREKTVFLGNLTATFVNRNTAATYFGSCAVVWLVLLMEKVRGRLPVGTIVWSEVPRHIVSDRPGERAILLRFCMFFVCLAALFATASRAGVVLSLAVMGLAFVVYFRRDLPRDRKILPLMALGLLAVVLLFQVMGGTISSRFQSGVGDQARLTVARSILQIIADHPWFGTGLGTFAWSFPPYRSASIPIVGVWDRAHSTPLELASEVGIPLAALVACGWLVAFAVLVRRVAGTRRGVAAPLAALFVSLIAVLHSAVDFSLQITGYAIVVFALLGVGLAQSLQTGEPPSERRKRKRDAGDGDAEAEGEQPRRAGT